MDFVAKTAFQSKLKKLGDDMGVKDLFGDNSVFNSGSEANQQDVERQTNENDIFPTSVASYFDSRPNNFPPVLKLFYIDRSILSHHATNAVKWANRLFLSIEILLGFNIVTRVTAKILRGKDENLLNLILSIVFAALFTFFQIVMYETAFSGAYRTSKKLRGRYLIFCAVNACILGLYSFFGFGWFNGWSAISSLRNIEKKSRKTTLVSLAIIESLAWTATFFMALYTAFEYYNLYNGGFQGLSDAARHEANTAFDDPPPTQNRSRDPPSHDQNLVSQKHLSRDARIQQIKEKYIGQSS